ncbi:hypothetical protein [Paenibacillus sp. sgz302251]
MFILALLTYINITNKKK